VKGGMAPGSRRKEDSKKSRARRRDESYSQWSGKQAVQDRGN